MSDWKLMFGFWDCDNWDFEDEMLFEVDMPFIPRIGEVVWLPDECIEHFNEIVTKCWRKKHCENCPYIYGLRESEEDISTDDLLIVANIVHDIDNRRTIVSLKNP